MSEQLINISAELKQKLLNIDIRTFDPSNINQHNLICAFKNTSDDFVCMIIGLYLVINIVVAIAVGNVVFAVATVLAAIAVCIVVALTKGNYLIKNSDLEGSLLELRKESLVNQITLLELDLGGIYQFSACFSFDGLETGQIESCLSVMKRSAVGTKITKVDIYYLILSRIVKHLQNENCNERLKNIEAEMASLTLEKSVVAS